MLTSSLVQANLGRITTYRNILQHTGMFSDVVIMTGGNAPVNRRLEDSPRTEAERRGHKRPYDRPDPSG